MRGGEEEKVGPVSRSDAFFHAVFTFYRKSFPFQPPSPILPSVSIQSEYPPHHVQPALTGTTLMQSYVHPVYLWHDMGGLSISGGVSQIFFKGNPLLFIFNYQ